MMTTITDNIAAMGYKLVESLTGNDNSIQDYFSKQGIKYSQENVLTYGILRKEGMGESDGTPSEGKVLLKQLRDTKNPVAFTWASVDFLSDVEFENDGYMYAKSSPGNEEPGGMEYGKERIQIIKLMGTKDDVDAVLRSMDSLECGSGYKRIQIPMIKQDVNKRTLYRKDKANMYLRKDDKLNPDFDNKLVICKDDETFKKARNKMQMGGAAFFSEDVSEWHVVQRGE